MARKTVDPLKAKQKKQKILAAVLGVLFVGLLAFQGPRVWKQLHPPATAQRPSYENATTTTASTPTLAAPTLGSGSQTPGTSPASSDPSLASASAPALADGQLTSFSRFASKDPFAQQVSDEKTSSSSSSSAGSTKSSGSGSKSSSGGGSASAPTPGTAVISVNGTLYTVAVGSDFPTSTDSSVVPLFHLVSVTAHSAKIAIVGGSYSSGAATVTLHENKTVTLMNTADGTRYKLTLKPVGTAVAAAPARTTTNTSTTVTVPPPSSP
jgi:hypothetical protein